MAEERQIGKAILLALCETRLAEARTLLNSGQPSGAYYLAGYAVELRIRAIISDEFMSGVIPDPNFVRQIHTHNLKDLIRLAVLDAPLKHDEKINPTLAANWSLVAEWSEQSRYRVFHQESARALVNAVGDPEDGVLAWLVLRSLHPSS